MEIPKSDFDFESANAKFNKEDLIKEAIASGSPPVPGADENVVAEAADADTPSNATPSRKDSLSAPGAAYNKSSSFFDNISSEAKDRSDGQDGRVLARQVRGEEFKKNIETFGQGNVDGGYRGRGRGGGGYGRGRPYGGTFRGGHNNNRGYGGYRGGNRGRGGPGQAPQAQPPAPAGQTAAQF
jgi:protein LSM14